MHITKIGLLAALFSLNLFASAVEFTGNATESEVEGQTLKIYDTADIAVEGNKVAVKRTGKGMRSSFLGSTYYIVSYADSAVTLEEGKLNENLKASKADALQLTLYMRMDGGAIRGAFLKALNKNKPYNEAGIKALLDQFDFTIDAGEAITIVGTQLASGEEAVLIELPNGKTIEGKGKELASDLWKVWFGVPVDAQMGSLQKKLIGKVQ